MTLSDSVSAAANEACARVAHALLAGRVSRDSLQMVHGAIARDRMAFSDDFAAWAFLLSVLPSLRLAAEAMQRAEQDERRLRKLVADERATFERMRACAVRAGGPLLEEFKSEPVPVGLRVGVKNKTELRDAMVQSIRHTYPSPASPGGAWRAAIAVAGLLWPSARFIDLQHLKRDTRRRYKANLHFRSRAGIYYARSVLRGDYARVLADAEASLRGGEGAD